MKKFDAIIIGTGQAGTPLAKKLANSGLQTAIIEKGLVGGTCINDGCTPTKAMIASARMAYNATRNDLGIQIADYSVALEKIVARKNEIVERFRNSSVEGLQETEGLTLYDGEASFTGHKTLSVATANEEISLTAEKIFIDIGLMPNIPEIDGLDKAPYFTSTSLLNSTELPDHLLILGGGYIGLEFGQMFSRFGSKVTILERGSQLMSREDEDVAAAVKKILEEENINVLTRFKVQDIEQNNQVVISDGKQQVAGTHILLATGRKPQTESLHLEKTEVETDDKGYIKVNDQLETNVPGIYAMGDVKGGAAFTHISYNDYILLSQFLLEGKQFSIKERQIPYCMFTDPQLGRIGMTEKEAREKGYAVEIACLSMDKTSRGIETGNTKGLMKAVVEKSTGQILGAALLGEEGGEVMSVLQMAMLGGFTASQIRNQIFAHPLYSESLNNLFMTLEK